MQDYTLPGVFLPSEWHECARDFLRQVHGRRQSEHTLRRYRSTLVTFFSMSPQKHPTAYTRADIEQFLWLPCASPGKQDCLPSPGTRNCRLTVIRSFYKFAGNYFQVHNPAATIPYAQTAQSPHALSDDELDRFFAAIPNTPQGMRDRAIMATYFWTGRRREEIARLRYGDIEPALFIEHGTPRHGWRYSYIGKGKAGRPQYAELPKAAKLAIDRYLTASGRMKDIQAGDPLFLPIGPKQGGGWHRDMSDPLTGGAIASLAKKYARLAGIKQMNIHRLRHTAAKQRLDAGVNIVVLKEYLGHASLDYTYRYAQSMTGTGDPEAQLLEARFAHLSGG